MNVRQRVYGALTDPVAAADLIALLAPERIYEASAMPDAVEPMYGVLRFGSRVPAVGGSRFLMLDFWVHDTPGTYTTIERVLEVAHPLIIASIGPTDTGWLSAVEWNGESDDLYDDATRTVARYRTYRLVGTGV